MSNLNHIRLPDTINPDWREDIPESLAFRALELFTLSQQDDVDGARIPASSDEEMQEMLDAYADSTIYAVTTDEDIDGVSIHHHTTRNITFIEGVAVHPDARRSGVATQLVAAIIADAKRHGTAELHTHAQPSATAADVAIIHSVIPDTDTVTENTSGDAPFVKITVKL